MSYDDEMDAIHTAYEKGWADAFYERPNPYNPHDEKLEPGEFDAYNDGFKKGEDDRLYGEG